LWNLTFWYTNWGWYYCAVIYVSLRCWARLAKVYFVVPLVYLLCWYLNFSVWFIKNPLFEQKI
jgi:hypothetical protein